MTNQIEEKDLQIHIRMVLTLNDSTYSWNDPSVQTQIETTVLADMFHSPSFTKLIEGKIEALKKVFPEAKTRYDEKVQEEEERKRLEEGKAEEE